MNFRGRSEGVLLQFNLINKLDGVYRTETNFVGLHNLANYLDLRTLSEKKVNRFRGKVKVKRKSKRDYDILINRV